MSETIEPLKKIVKGSSIVLAGIFISKVLGYIYRLLVARIGPEQYGLLSLALAITGILTTVSLLGLSSGVVRYIPFFKGKNETDKINFTIRESLKLTTFLGLIFSILVFIFSDKLSLILFNSEALIPILRVMSFSILFGSITLILYNIMIAFQKVQHHAIMKNFFENTIKIILTFILILLGYGVLGAAYGYLFALTLSSIISFILIKKHIHNFKIFKTIKDSKLKKDLLSYSLPLLFNGLLVSIILWTDSLMLGRFETASSVGIYNAALPTAQLMFIIPYIFMTLFLPMLSELYGKNKRDILNSLYLRISKWIFFLNLFLFSFFFLFARPIIKVLFGSEYSQAAIPLIILSLGFFIGYLQEPIEKMLMVLKKTKTILYITIYLTISNIILNYILIPKFGIIGAATATSTSYISSLVLFAIVGYFKTKINPYKLTYAFNFVIFIFLISLIKFFSPDSLIIKSSLFVIVSLFMVFILSITKIFEKEDIHLIKLIYRRLVSFSNK